MILIPHWIVDRSHDEIVVPSEFQYFPQKYQHINTATTLQFSSLSLLWNAIVAGLLPPPSYRAAVPSFSKPAMTLFTQWRVASSLDFIEPFRARGKRKYELRRSSAYSILEATEKGQIGYAIGSMMTSAFVSSSCTLDCPYMLHMSLLKKLWPHWHLSSVRSLPDYACFDQSGRLVAFAEAKCRNSTSGWSDVKRDLQTKRQFTALNPPRHNPQIMRIGCATVIPETPPLSFYAVDPEIDIPHRLLQIEDPIRLYYDSLQRLFSESDYVERGEDIQHRIDNTVGLLERGTSPDRQVFAQVIIPPEIHQHLQNPESFRYEEAKKEIVGKYSKRLIMPDLTLLILSEVEAYSTRHSSSLHQQEQKGD